MKYIGIADCTRKRLSYIDAIGVLVANQKN